MVKLWNKSKSLPVASEVVEANTFSTRLFGLMGKSHWPAEKTMWFPKCQWIHTSFMRFPMDAIFVDRQMKVISIRRMISPWKFLLPVFNSYGVFEFSGGVTEQKVEIGDQLYVGTENP